MNCVAVNRRVPNRNVHNSPVLIHAVSDRTVAALLTPSPYREGRALPCDSVFGEGPFISIPDHMTAHQHSGAPGYRSPIIGNRGNHRAGTAKSKGVAGVDLGSLGPGTIAPAGNGARSNSPLLLSINHDYLHRFRHPCQGQ
jgi:hypothetical protein